MPACFERRYSLIIDDTQDIAKLALVAIRVRLGLPYPALDRSSDSTFRGNPTDSNVRHIQPVVS
jgi:hypothetical protein